MDAERQIPDPLDMIAQPYHLYIERTDASKNMARYYAIEISAKLFGEACLTRSRGRIVRRGQTKTHHFAREQDAVFPVSRPAPTEAGSMLCGWLRPCLHAVSVK
ncbi:WGR domain-containing protein (plasmid) [Rhizobium leguminosarum]